jgi:peroxiredoxin family protein
MSKSARPDNLSIVVYSGSFDKVHYALVLASAAAAVGTHVTLFFTMEACGALKKNPSSAWQDMPVGLKNSAAQNGGALDDGFSNKGIATFEELLSACSAMGVKIMVCEMGLRAMDMNSADLRDDIKIETGGVVSFLNKVGPNGASFFI